jgi:hypothetical protein
MFFGGEATYLHPSPTFSLFHLLTLKLNQILQVLTFNLLANQQKNYYK